MINVIEKTKVLVRELEDDLTEEYESFGKVVWHDVQELRAPDEVITYTGLTASFVLHDGCEAVGGGGKQDGTGELDVLLAKLLAIAELAEELGKIKTSLFDMCEEVEEGK
jgi:hypothetical protein